MIARLGRFGLLGLVTFVVGLVLAVWCWAQARSTSPYPPITEGPHPAATGYQGVRYDGSWIGLAVLAAIAAVVGLFVAIGRMRSS